MIDEQELQAFILLALDELGGSAKRADALRVAERLLGSRLQPDDLSLRPSGHDIVWRNNASFARNVMVDKKLLYPTKKSGHGVWMLTPDGACEAAALRSLTIPALCPTFRSVATDVTWRTEKGRSVGLVPGETTFTDNALLQLAVSHPRNISIQRFTSHREAETGADWEWWIRDRDGYVGFRIQAKRVHPTTGRIALDQRAAATVSPGKQIDVFVDRCRTDGIAGLYCLYGDRQPSWRPNIAAAGPCPHGPVDTAQWACTVVLAETAWRLASERYFDAETVLAAGMPWYHLVCHHAITGLTSGLHHIFDSLKASEATSRNRAGDNLDRRTFSPPPATEPPAQVAAYFLRDLNILEPWSGLAGVVLIDATDEANPNARQVEPGPRDYRP